MASSLSRAGSRKGSVADLSGAGVTGRTSIAAAGRSTTTTPLPPKDITIPSAPQPAFQRPPPTPEERIIRVGLCGTYRSDGDSGGYHVKFAAKGFESDAGPGNMNLPGGMQVTQICTAYESLDKVFDSSVDGVVIAISTSQLDEFYKMRRRLDDPKSPLDTKGKELLILLDTKDSAGVANTSSSAWSEREVSYFADRLRVGTRVTKVTPEMAVVGGWREEILMSLAVRLFPEHVVNFFRSHSLTLDERRQWNNAGFVSTQKSQAAKKA